MSPQDRALALNAAVDLYTAGVVPEEDLRTDAPTRVALDRAWTLVRRRAQRTHVPPSVFPEEAL